MDSLSQYIIEKLHINKDVKTKFEINPDIYDSIVNVKLGDFIVWYTDIDDIKNIKNKDLEEFVDNSSISKPLCNSKDQLWYDEVDKTKIAELVKLIKKYKNSDITLYQKRDNPGSVIIDFELPFYDEVITCFNQEFYKD